MARHREPERPSRYKGMHRDRVDRAAAERLAEIEKAEAVERERVQQQGAEERHGES